MQKRFLFLLSVVMMVGLSGCASIHLPWQHSVNQSGKQHVSSVTITRSHSNHSTSPQKNTPQETPMNDGTPIQNLMA